MLLASVITVKCKWTKYFQVQKSSHGNTFFDRKALTLSSNPQKYPSFFPKCFVPVLGLQC